jgi:tight adherence protein B
VLIGALLVALAVAIGVLLLMTPGPPRLPADRRRPPQEGHQSLLTRLTNHTTALIEGIMSRRGAAGGMTLLDEAGLRTRPQDYVLLALVAAVVLGGAGLIAVGPLLAVLIAAVVMVCSRLLLTVLAGRRRAAFADQLEETLQLMSSNLRAGHSLLQSLASVAEESEEPTRTEFTRILNETRVGRDLGSSLTETADRMQSQDFVWATQAIAINREVGGNLADVLDGVGSTIRERGQIRRQVEGLAAEGKLSALILMLLPIGITGFLMLTNPAYLAPFTQSLPGWGLLALAIVMMLIGGLWMRKTVRITF